MSRHGRLLDLGNARASAGRAMLLLEGERPAKTCADSRFQTAADMSVCVFATQNRVRAVACAALSIEEGAGNAGCPPHPRPPCIMKEPQVWSGQSRPSLRNGFNAYGALPGDRAFLPPSPREPGFAQAWHQRRGARTTRLCRTRTPSPTTRDRPGTGPPQFWRKRASIARPATPPRPSHPALHVRDDREAPLR
jgi:hypothetical protein